MALNKVMLIGNVGKDPEVRYLDGNAQGGQATKVATITLATSERYRDRSGELRENTEWHSVVAWRGLADLAEKYIRKGTQIYVEGRIRTRSWTDQTGAKRYTTEIQADTIQLLGRRPDAQGSQPAYQPQPASPVQSAYQPQPAVQQPAGPVDFTSPVDDDLPF